jgi:hypothetical protein
LAIGPSNDAGLLADGKLYLFADMYLADNVKKATFAAIKIRVECSLINAAKVQALVDFLRYLAGQDCTDEDVGVGPFRKYVVTFAAKNLARLITFESFKALLTDGGEMLKDIVVASHSEIRQ